MKKLYLYGFLALLFTVSYFIGKPGYEQIRDGWSASDWPTVQGIVTLSELSSREDADNSTTYTFNIVYKYKLDGIQYSNSKFAPREETAYDTDDLAEFLQEYPVGSHVEVHYNPSDPANSLLDPGMQFGSWFLVILASVLALFAFWVLLADLRG